MSNNRICKICGKSYHYCPTCPRDADKPSWMTRFDSDTCKKLWDILVANGNGSTTDAETVQKLNALNYKSLEIDNQGVRDHIAKLTGFAPTPLTKEEIRDAVTETVKKPEPKPEVKPEQKQGNVPPVVQQAVSTAADTMHKKNGFKFLGK